MTETGTVKYWNDERGFGFVAPDQGGSNVFAHVSRGNGSPV
jgi:cold shock CspA family protein